MKSLITLLFFAGILNSFGQEQFTVYFGSDKYELKKSEQTRLDQWLAANKDAKVIGAYGFTDEEGSIGYNDTLARKRVDYVFNQIKNRIKIREDFKSLTFGKLHTMSKVKAENRKVTLYYILPKDFAREEEIVKGKDTSNTSEEKPKSKPVIKYPEQLVFENPDGTKTTLKMDTIFMKKIAAAPKGEKLKLENLNFVVSTFIVLNESRPKMYELLYVLQNNPDLKIEIQGHLCCDPIDKQDLSTQRAKAIYKFLTWNGIDKSRLSYKGFGSTQPLYPIPEKSEQERAANRRVEILILEN